MKTYSKVILGVILIIIVFGLIYIFSDKTPSIKVLSPVSGDSGQEKKVTFVCDAGKSIGATFYIGDDKFVDLVLSDGRTLSVPRAVSASGARYANTDETFVFWNKGDTAFITEGENSKTTFSNCVLKNEPVIGGDRDVNGCLISAGYSFNQSVGACIRAFEMTPDIMKASKLAVDSIGSSYALTVASFNSYEEAGAYDIFLEQGVDRVKRTIYIKNWKVVSDPSLTCHESSKYFVVEKSLAPNVGSNIIIKYKTTPSQKLACAYNVNSGDFEITNANAQYFLAFTDNFILIDQGTAPEPRELIVYDLRTQKQVFTDSYAKPVDVAGDSITYLSKTNIKPTTQNCPDLKTYTENGLGAVIMSKVTVNLLTLSRKDLGQSQCRATQ